MALKMTDIAFTAKLPDVPATMPVFALATASLADRQAAIKRLGDYLKLDALRSVDLDHATVMASARGDVHYFHASGAVMARDATADRDQPNEMRKWDGTERTRDGTIMLNADAARRLLAGARELLEPIGLLGRQVSATTVQLEQVAQLDEKGNQIAQGVGQATAKFTYAVGGRACARRRRQDARLRRSGRGSDALHRHVPCVADAGRGDQGCGSAGWRRGFRPACWAIPSSISTTPPAIAWR